MTYAEAIEKGYKETNWTWQRGYVSRKVNFNTQTVLYSGKNGKGCAYILLPSWESSNYCVRQYLAAPDE